VIHQQFAQIIEELEPIPKPTKEECVYDKTFVGAMRRFKRRKRSHHMFLPEYRWKNQIETNTLSDFFAKEAPFNKNGKPMWHAQARVCINLRQLLQTDTIEFRHFPATINSKEFEDSLIWCDNFVRAVLEHKSIIETWAKIKNQLIFPKFAPYRHDLDVIYRRTCWDGTVDKSTIAENIESILRGKPKILVVCLGNINRSPAIESILKKRQYPTKSAGFLSKHSSASHKTVEFMMSLGYDISQHKSRQVTETMCEWADIILVTTSKHQERMRTLFPKYKTKVKCFYNDLLDPGPLEGDSFCNVMNNLVKQTQLFLDVLVDPGGKFFDDAIKHGLFS
jgi:protein-tyrosine-phosphatase